MQREAEAVVLLLQDNAPVHTTQVSVTEAADCSFKLRLYPSFLPDLVPS